MLLCELIKIFFQAKKKNQKIVLYAIYGDNISQHLDINLSISVSNVSVNSREYGDLR